MFELFLCTNLLNSFRRTNRWQSWKLRIFHLHYLHCPFHTQHSWAMTFLRLRFLTLPLRGVTWLKHLKLPPRGLEDRFLSPKPDTRELIASTFMRPECPQTPDRLGLESTILNTNFASTYVTIYKKTSSNGREKIVLTIKCFWLSSSTKCPETNELDLILKYVFDFCRSTTQKIPIARDHLEIPTKKKKRQKKCSWITCFVLSLDQIVSAIFADLPTVSSANWRQCHWPHSSWEPLMMYASAATQIPN